MRTCVRACVRAMSEIWGKNAGRKIQFLMRSQGPIIIEIEEILVVATMKREKLARTSTHTCTPAHPVRLYNTLNIHFHR